MKKLFFLILAQVVCFAAPAQGPVTVQAESGSPGLEWLTLPDPNALLYVTPATDGAGQNPGSANRVITYTVTFPEAGNYDLFLRMRVNSGGATDDSFFYGKGFGAKSPSNDGDWVMANSLYASGYASSSSVVQGEGQDGTGVWKWLNLSEFNNGGAPPMTFEVSESALTQTFQIGARENGLDIDQLVFGQSDLYFTVSNLDNGEQGSTTPPPPPFVPSGPPIAEGKDKFLGSAHSNAQNTNFEKYWNQVTPENGGKWGSVEGTKDVMNWSAMDDAYQLARGNGFLFKQHVMVWGSQEPGWIGVLSPEEQLAEIIEWYEAVASRYPDLEIVEVVNEPLHAPPSYKEALGGDGTSGWDWIIKSYELAREHFPNASLILNDYGILGNDQNITRYLEIAQLLTDRGLLDHLGVQGHAFTVNNMSYEGITNSLDRLAGSGLPLYVTELDIDGPTDEIQLNRYKAVFPAMWEHPAVQGVTLWGYRPGHWRTDEGAYIANSDGTERPALTWLRDYVRGNLKEETPRYTWLEPECGTVGSNWEIVADTSASNDTYVTIRSGLNSTTNPPSGDSTAITIPFEVDTSTSYQVKARVNCANGDDDSFWVKLDDGDFITANGLTTTGWQWVSLTSGSLDSGSHTLTITYREDGAKLDKIVVTNSFSPLSGKGETAGNCGDQVVNEKPVIDPSQSFTINDQVQSNDPVGVVTGSDPDQDELQDWQIVGGSGVGKFSVDASSGELSVTDRSSLDFENTTSYTLEVTVSDGKETSDGEMVVINLTHAPVVVAGQVFKIDYVTYMGEVVGVIEATDADYDDLHDWNVVGGYGSLYFDVYPETGEIYVIDTNYVNYNRGQYDLQVTVSDGANTSAVESVIMHLNDRVQICHNGEEKWVPEQAVPGHLGHGDNLGECQSGQRQSGAFSANEDAQLRIYPNPVTTGLSVDLGTNPNRVSRIELMDLSGRIVRSTEVGSNLQFHWAVSDLKRGIYFLRLKGNKIQSSKILIE